MDTEFDILNARTVSQLDNKEQTLQQTVQRPVLRQRRREADRPSAGTACGTDGFQAQGESILKGHM